MATPFTPAMMTKDMALAMVERTRRLLSLAVQYGTVPADAPALSHARLTLERMPAMLHIGESEPFFTDADFAITQSILMGMWHLFKLEAILATALREGDPV